MSLRIALTTAPVSMEERYGSFANAGSTEPSFGLLSLATVASGAGHKVNLIDASAMGLSVDQTVHMILENASNVVGISSTTMGIYAAAELAEKIKQNAPCTSIILGGCHATALPEDTLMMIPDVDLIVLREGEETFVQILEKIESCGSIPSEIKGTAYRDKTGKPVIAPQRNYIKPLDSLPLPDWSLINGFPKQYHPSPARIKRWPCASVVLTRGCPNKCTFCDRSVFGNACRAYSPEYAFRMLRDLRINYGVMEILIEDDTFVIRKENVKKLCEMILRENLDISWSCLGRVDSMDPDILCIMKQAGCWHISYGIESGSPAILERVNKNINLDSARQTLEWTRRAGIESKGFFILGLPGETRKTIEQTRQLVRTLPVDDITVMQFTPFPGSEEFRRLTTSGKFDHDWRRMNSLNTTFVPVGLTTQYLDDARKKILRTFYSRPDVLVRHMRKILLNPGTIPHMAKGLLALRKAASK